MAYTYHITTAHGDLRTVVADEHEEIDTHNIIRRVLLLKSGGEVKGRFQAYGDWWREPYVEPSP